MILPSSKFKFGSEIQQPCQQNIIGVGQFTIVHKLSPKIVRKVPSDQSYFYSARAVEIEGHVYGHLGKHKRIARCIGWGDDFVDLRYECNGDLETYLRKAHLTRYAKYRIARQAVEAVAFIHGKDVFHSDLSACQFLGSDAIVMENATHFLPRDEDAPNTIRSDLFALGSTVYEILLGKKPYEGMDDEEIQRLFSDKVFPTLNEIGDQQWRCIVQKCWMCEYDCAEDILKDMPSVPCSRRILTKIQYTISNGNPGHSNYRKGTR
ncbi:STYKc [Aspergillus sclerotialis]|uniref:STYKc n=1 Tax=Aspergillus sclerotialis TaxID=2070753 RepID=A0A3A2ZHN3_9EURO|nr:STYKc [Aspergillus sclerotialis]